MSDKPPSLEARFADAKKALEELRTALAPEFFTPESYDSDQLAVHGLLLQLNLIEGRKLRGEPL